MSDPFCNASGDFFIVMGRLMRLRLIGKVIHSIILRFLRALSYQAGNWPLFVATALALPMIISRRLLYALESQSLRRWACHLYVEQSSASDTDSKREPYLSLDSFVELKCRLTSSTFPLL